MKRLLKIITAFALIGLTACSGSDSATTESGVETFESLSASESGVDPLANVKSFEVAPVSHHPFDDLPLTYAQNPPVGGDHLIAPFWQNCGFYDKPVRDETAVHSMEHGAVWVTYLPTLPADQIAVLEAAVIGHPYLLVSPRQNLPTPVVASAWGKQLTLVAADDPGLTAFIDAFENGPQTPEPGSPCSGGLDITADEPPPVG